MNAPIWFIALVVLIGTAALWLSHILYRLKILEKKETLDKIKTDAKAHGSIDVDSLIELANKKRRDRQNSEGK